MSPACAPALLQAPSHWRQVDFIADLHLQSGDSSTFGAWRRFMQTTKADALFILGDLFEVWVGDDVIHQVGLDSASTGTDPGPGLALRCAELIKTASDRLDVYFMHGNRDFLMGPAYADACGMQLLEDPTVLDFGGQRWLLSHGDALCLDDADYMRFRALVRSQAWRREFLGRPLAERQASARAMRSQSEARKSRDAAKGAVLADLDASATREWMRAAGAGTLIHGHTHRPAEHDLGQGLRRLVLSDWDGDASPARLSFLRLSLPCAGQAGAIARVERLASASA